MYHRNLVIAFLAIHVMVFSNDGQASPAENFSQCLTNLSQQAEDAGINQETRAIISTLSFQDRVLELDRSQPEFIQTFPQYFSKRVNDWRINKGQEQYQKHKKLLLSLTEKYGVPGSYLMAFWGLETNFGGYKGTLSTLDSLATLACDKRRQSFFTKEFILALKLVEREQLEPTSMKGSWAGAMGHTQFMPSTYMQYAIDGDGDGKVNLWDSEADALSSAANFLHQLGWKAGLRWGREVSLPENFDYRLIGKDNKRSVSEWKQAGVLASDGTPLPNSDIQGVIRVPAGHKGPAFLTYDNFTTILRWNNSEFYAIAVGHLANRIAGAKPLTASLPELPSMVRDDIKTIQRQLAKLGYAVGGADGIIGPATRSGIRAFQIDQGLIADGFPSPQTIASLAKKIQGMM